MFERFRKMFSLAGKDEPHDSGGTNFDRNSSRDIPSSSRPPGGRPITITQPHGRYTSLGYDAWQRLARVDRRFSGGAQPGHVHERFGREKLLAQSRDFFRNNLIYKGIIDRALDFIVGGGFELQAKNREVDRLWDEWLDTAEVTGRYRGVKLARAIGREFFVTGEAIIKKVQEDRLQLIEAEQVRGHEDSGITYDAVGRVQSFRVHPWTAEQKPILVPAREMLYVCDYERPSSQRGVPLMQSAFPMLHRIADVCDSEAISWSLLSRLFLKYQSDGEDSPFAPSASTPLQWQELSYATVAHIGRDDLLESMTRDIPGKNFGDTLREFCRLLGLPVGMPLELILMDWTRSNYSQSKAALLLSWKRFESLQNIFLQDFYEPLFDWWFTSLVARGAVEDTPENREHKFITPQYPWLDAAAEVSAYEKKLALGLTTHSDVVKALQEEREQVLDQRESEIRDAIERSRRLAEETGERVPWQHWCGITIGKTEQATVAKNATVNATDEEDDA
ncbi:MAG: phage portal protein [Clostridiales bacterium]|nr:phage portal protein [Clostridiales bacterium]